MGRLASATCPCGFIESVVLGGNRASHLTSYRYPHLCYECNSVFSGNLYQSEIVCSECGGSDTKSYEELTLRQPRKSSDLEVEYSGNMFLGKSNALESIQDSPGGLFSNVWRWFFSISVKPRAVSKYRKLILYKGGYSCPKCKVFSLSFETTAFLD
jgi:hypothetical protein